MLMANKAYEFASYYFQLNLWIPTFERWNSDKFLFIFIAINNLIPILQ